MVLVEKTIFNSTISINVTGWYILQSYIYFYNFEYSHIRYSNVISQTSSFYDNCIRVDNRFSFQVIFFVHNNLFSVFFDMLDWIFLIGLTMLDTLSGLGLGNKTGVQHN